MSMKHTSVFTLVAGVFAMALILAGAGCNGNKANTPAPSGPEQLSESIQYQPSETPVTPEAPASEVKEPVEQPKPETQKPVELAPKQPAKTPKVEAPTPEPKTETPPPAAKSEVKTFTVVGKSFSFSPAQIKVNKGDTVKIIFQNADGFHDWVVDEFNAKTSRIQANETAKVTFVADKTGAFEYYCSVGSHRANGMKGNLIVE